MSTPGVTGDRVSRCRQVRVVAVANARRVSARLFGQVEGVGVLGAEQAPEGLLDLLVEAASRAVGGSWLRSGAERPFVGPASQSHEASQADPPAGFRWVGVWIGRPVSAVMTARAVPGRRCTCRCSTSMASAALSATRVVRPAASIPLGLVAGQTEPIRHLRLARDPAVTAPAVRARR